LHFFSFPPFYRFCSVSDSLSSSPCGEFFVGFSRFSLRPCFPLGGSLWYEFLSLACSFASLTFLRDLSPPLIWTKTEGLHCLGLFFLFHGGPFFLAAGLFLPRLVRLVEQVFPFPPPCRKCELVRPKFPPLLFLLFLPAFWFIFLTTVPLGGLPRSFGVLFVWHSAAFLSLFFPVIFLLS